MKYLKDYGADFKKAKDSIDRQIEHNLKSLGYI